MKKIKGLLYCCKAKPYLYKEITEWATIPISYGLYTRTMGINNYLNGTIPCECEIEVEEICSEKIDVGVGYEPLFYTETIDDITKGSCLTQFEIENYLGCKEGGEVVGYALHISNLNIFDKPLELNGYSDLFLCDKDKNNRWEQIRKAPKSWQYVRNIDNELCILISIKSEDLCKILNREKTIVVRKQVLNCMKGNE